MNGGSVITNEACKCSKTGRVCPWRQRISEVFRFLNPRIHLFCCPGCQMVSRFLRHQCPTCWSSISPGTDDNTSDYIMEGAAGFADSTARRIARAGSGQIMKRAAILCGRATMGAEYHYRPFQDTGLGGAYDRAPGGRLYGLPPWGKDLP